MTEINPYPVPVGMHPFVKYLVRPGGMSLDGDFLNSLASHLDLVGFVHLGEMDLRRDLVINVGLPNREAHIVGEPGGMIDWEIPDGHLSHCRVEGQLPPGVELLGGRLVGVCSIPGIWQVTVIVGPAIKFDSLGNGGTPLDPGEWIPVDQPRVVPHREAAGLNLQGLCREDLDDVIAQAQAAKDDLETRS